MEPINLEGKTKELQIKFNDENLNKLNVKSLNQTNDPDYDSSKVHGTATTARKIITGINFDTNTKLKDFPYNFNDITLKFEFEAFQIPVKCIKNGESKDIIYE